MKSLAVKYRPNNWDSVIGQHTVIKILKNLIEYNTFKHSMLFSGGSGCGKTSCARLFARSIDGEIIEIDAASNNGVDNIRTIMEDARTRSISHKYKVYIIDEVQALSQAAFQAFLKGIEEPYDYTIFILCTTDPQKIPITVLNRLQRFNFTKVPTNEIVDRLNYICEQEGFINYLESTQYIGKIVNGCAREALTLLDKCADYSIDLNVKNVLEVLGYQSYDRMIELTNSILDGNEANTLYIIENIYNEGSDLKLFIDQYIDFILDVDKYILFNNFDLIKIPLTLENELKNLINFENPSNYYNYVLNKLLELKNMLKNDSDIKSTIEIILLQISRMQ